MAEDVKDLTNEELEDLEDLEEGKDATVVTGSEETKAGEETVVTTEDPERTAIRERRKQEKEERKRRQREAIARRDRHIQGLERTVQNLSAQVTQLAERTTGSDMARVDVAIESAAQEIELSSAAMQEAMKAQDSKIFSEAQDAWYTARRKQEELTAFKRSVVNGQKREPAQSLRPAPHPDLVENAKKWMGQNKWFDPNLSDEDSRIAHVIDQGMAREGLDPRTPEYWEELTDRVKERLPRRFAAGGPAASGSRQITGSGSGRESPGGSARVTISAERIAAMREAGIDWDDPKVRARMIKRFQDNDASLAH